MYVFSLKLFLLDRVILINGLSNFYLILNLALEICCLLFRSVAPLAIDLEENADGVRAFLVLSHILEIESLAGPRRVRAGLFGEGDQIFAPLILGQRLEMRDEPGQRGRVGHSRNRRQSRSIGARTLLPHSVHDPS